MAAKGLGKCARKLDSTIASIKSMDALLPVACGESRFTQCS
jgi:hypothetical protein